MSHLGCLEASGPNGGPAGRLNSALEGGAHTCLRQGGEGGLKAAGVAGGLPIATLAHPGLS